MYKKIFLFPVFLTLCYSVIAQQRPVDSMRSVTIDSVLVISAKAGLSAEDFIDEMMRDTLFYHAFRSMREYSFIAENLIRTYDKKYKPLSKIYRKIFHNNSGPQYKSETIASADS